MRNIYNFSFLIKPKQRGNNTWICEMDMEWVLLLFQVTLFGLLDQFLQIFNRAPLNCLFKLSYYVNFWLASLCPFPFQPQTMLYFNLYVNVMFSYKYVFLSILSSVIKLT